MTERVTPVLVALLLVFGAGGGLHAQTLTPSQQARLDGRFERVVRADLQGTLTEAIEAVPDPAERPGARRRPERRDAPSKSGAQREQASALSAPLTVDVRPAGYQRDGTPVYEAMVHTGDGGALDAPGVEVASAFEGFATVRATPTGLRALSQADGVLRVQSARRVRLHNDEAAAEVGARTLNRGLGGTPYQGQDVMACVIDSGIDWSHPDFADASGRTRIHSIWDQADDSTSVPSPAETNGARFSDNFNPSYGSEYRTRDVREGDVLQKDRNGHGTHVAGTVASSGNAFKQSNGVRKYRGVAPAANIIAVKTAFSTNTIIDAVNYCTDVAASEGKPVVVNMSLGTTFGPH
ncbi:MAG TPA: S8 family serine peptidase, partial [Salinibacter sp.]|nr:S8 family serine peptidase [Salinibacter sp.]